MRRLAVFAKPAVEGAVKTRLSPALPPALACALYAGMLADVLDAARHARADERFVYWASVPPAPGAVPGGMAGRRQAGDDLGARLTSAFDELLAPPCTAAVIVGADGPDVSSADLDAAFEALAAADAVVAPAADGGYGLIGLSRPAPDLFSGIAWSTPAVLEQTLARAASAGLRVATLRALDDIDTAADLARWIGRRAAEDGAGAAHTRAALVRMGLLPERAPA